MSARDGAGRPLEGAEVVLRSGGCRSVEVFRAADAEGLAAFHCPLGGVYEVTARQEGASASRTVEVKGGGTDIELVLERSR